jgi:hypothetical protein
MAALAMTGLSNIPKKRPKHASGNRNPQQVIEKREKFWRILRKREGGQLSGSATTLPSTGQSTVIAAVDKSLSIISAGS